MWGNLSGIPSACSRPHLALPQQIIPPGVHPRPDSAPGSKGGLEPPQPGRALSTGPLIPLYFLNETRASPARPGSGICHCRAARPEAPAGAGAGHSGSGGDGSSPILQCISHRCLGTPGFVPPADPSSSEPFVTCSKQEQPLNAPIKSGQLRFAVIPLGKSLIIINFNAALLLPAQWGPVCSHNLKQLLLCPMATQCFRDTVVSPRADRQGCDAEQGHCGVTQGWQAGL